MLYKDKEIEAMKNVLVEYAKRHGLCFSYEAYHTEAKTLINAGYGDVKEYQKKIDELAGDLDLTKKENKYWFGQAHRNYEDMRKGHGYQAVKELSEELNKIAELNAQLGCRIIYPNQIEELIKQKYSEFL